MTVEEVLTEFDKADTRLRELRQQLYQTKRGPITEAIAKLEQEIAEATARRDWLLDQIHGMEKAG
jgi:vacuolar-type H+-ATPase subunit H